MKSYVVLICASLIARDVKHIFTYLLAIWVSSFEMFGFSSFVLLLTRDKLLSLSLLLLLLLLIISVVF